jgi:tRNA(Ile)-lysidine synthase
MLVKVGEILKNHCKIQEDSLLLVGVSGGPDSLCLLHVLHELGYQVTAMHVNHQLRPEADEEALVVKQAAQNLGVEFFGSEVDVIDHASRNSLSIEGCTYCAIAPFNQAQSMGTDAEVVGHKMTSETIDI